MASTIKANAALLSSLIAYYKLEGNVTDSHGSNNGTAEKTISTVAGILRNCIAFDGNGDPQDAIGACQVLNLGQLLAGVNSFSISYWANTNSVSAFQQHLSLASWNGSEMHAQSRLCSQQPAGASGNVDFPYWGATGYVKVYAPLTNGAWIHWAITVDYNAGSGITTLSVYKNGYLVGSNANSIGIAKTSTIPLLVGGMPWDYFGTNQRLHQSNGKYDEIAIASRAWTPEEVRFLYHSGYPVHYDEVRAETLLSPPVGAGMIPEVVNLGQLEEGYSFVPVTDFEAVSGPEPKQITLSWVNPTSLDFEGVVVRRSKTGYPVSPVSGDLAYQGTDEGFVDSDLDSVLYYYSIFAYDLYHTYSDSRTSSCTPLEQPQVTGAVATSPTVVCVTYDMEMRHSDPDDPYDALNEANYGFTGDDPIVAYSVALYQTDPTIVDVTLTHEMTDGASYLLTVSNVRDLAHDHTLRDSTESFTGAGTRPRVSGAEVRPGYKVRITFNIAMKNDAALLEETNYDFTDGLEASLVEYVDSTHVDVSVGEMLISHLYTVTISNVHGYYGSHIADSPHNQTTFTGEGIAPTVAADAIQVDLFRFYIDYSENMKADEATTITNYMLDPTIDIVEVEQITATRYRVLLDGSVTPGVTYTLTISGVHDLAGNLIDAAHDTASFLGASETPPYLYIYPPSGSVDQPARDVLRIQAVDQELDFIGVDPTTWNVSITKDRITRVVMKDGVFDDGLFYGGITGSGDDPNDGLLLRFRPKHGHWEDGSVYTIHASVADMHARITTATWTLGFHAAELDFFEDAPVACDSDTKIAYPSSTFATTYPACEQLRQIFMRVCTRSVNPIAQVRTLQVVACHPSIRPVIAPFIDLVTVEATRLGDKVNPIELQTLLAKSMRVITEARNEVEKIVGATVIRPFDEYLRSGDAALVTGTVASLVIMATCV